MRRQAFWLLVGLAALLTPVGAALWHGSAVEPISEGASPGSLPRSAPGVPRLSLSALEPFPTAGVTEVSLVDVPWAYASTGWQVLADYDVPLRDTSFTWGPMAIAGEAFDRGISAYPFSEIVYVLDGAAVRFDARVGVTDDSKRGAGSVNFLVYGDEFLLFESDIVRAGEPAREISVPLSGLREMRLVVDDAGDGTMGDYALWAEPGLTTSSQPVPAAAAAEVGAARQARETSEGPLRASEEAAAAALADQVREAADRLRMAGPTAAAGFDRVSSSAVLANGSVAVTLGQGGARNGRLAVARMEDAAGRLVIDLMPAVVTADGRQIRLADCLPEPPGSTAFHRIEELDGAGVRAEARFQAPDGRGVLVIQLALFDGEPAFELGLEGEGLALESVRYADPSASTLILGEDVQYLTDRSHLYRGEARADGHLRRAPLEATKPGLVWSERASEGVLLASYDQVPSPTWLSFRRQPGQLGVALGVELRALLQDFGPNASSPPPITVELVHGPFGQDTFVRFRRVTMSRYPAAPWPEGARHQWGSWFVFGPGIDAPKLLRQVELLDRSFGDLGPWQFLVDAGWHIQYGREDAELGAVDFEKFPNGVREVAEAVHARGMEMLLYLGTGFVHDSPADGGEWLALRGLIEKHPDWLVPFQPEPSHVRRYLLDYVNPEVRDYLANVLEQFFVTHRADGILLDGVADAEGQLVPRLERDHVGGPQPVPLPVLDIYRLIRAEVDRRHPGAFVTSGWVSPTAANPHIQVFWYGDEGEEVDSPYPFAGFLQRLDYALYSRMALAQRSYLGATRGDPAAPHARWWVQAAAALGAPANLGFDLGRLDRTALAAFRGDLRAADPFVGETIFGEGLFPDWFATTRDGVTYLGLVNRDAQSRVVRVSTDSPPLSQRSFVALDVETGVGRRIEGDLIVELPPKSFRLLALREQPGILWTTSSAAVAASEHGLDITASGPAIAPGILHLATPPPAAVLVDGASVPRSPAEPRPGQYAYDQSSGLLSVVYGHAGPRRIEVQW